MPPTSSLNPNGQYFELQLLEAWQLLQREQYDAANTMSRELLLDPAMSDVHRAGFHLVLAHSPDQAVEHAREAIRIFTHMYEGVENMIPTEAERLARQKFLDYAESLLGEAAGPMIQSQAGSTEEELHAAMIREARSLAAAESAVEAAAEAMGTTGELEILFSDEVNVPEAAGEELEVLINAGLKPGGQFESGLPGNAQSSAVEETITGGIESMDISEASYTTAATQAPAATGGSQTGVAGQESAVDTHEGASPSGQYSPFLSEAEDEPVSPRLPSGPQPREDVRNPFLSPSSSPK